MQDLKELKAAAEAATQNWYEDKWGALMVSEDEPMYMRGATIASAGSRVEQAKLNTKFIAAANPTVILSLIAELEQLRAEKVSQPVGAVVADGREMSDAECREKLGDYLVMLLDAKEAMRAQGIEQNDFPEMFAELLARAAKPAKPADVGGVVELPPLPECWSAGSYRPEFAVYTVDQMRDYARAALAAQTAAPALPEFSRDPDGDLALDWVVGDVSLSVSFNAAGVVSWATEIDGASACGSQQVAQDSGRDAALNQLFDGPVDIPEAIAEKDRYMYLRGYHDAAGKAMAAHPKKDN